jgi:hypothetical protein
MDEAKFLPPFQKKKKKHNSSVTIRYILAQNPCVATVEEEN